MAKNQTKTLLSLVDLEKDILVVSNKKNEIEEEQQTLQSKLEQYKKKLTEVETAHKEVLTRQEMEERLLRDEESKIIERRKQLTALGGAKAAKLVEREIDIASRTLTSMEEKVGQATVEAEALGNQLEVLKSSVSELEEDSTENGPQQAEELKDLVKDFDKLSKQKDKLMKGLEDRICNLYNRVQKRYPGDPVSIASKNSCRTCYRALPHQLYNQVLSGNFLIQCPGCSRILVYQEEKND